MRGLKGKIAAVTGAASGIGEAAARRLAEEGCKVAILDRNSEGAAAVAYSIASSGATAIAIACDVGDEASVEAAFRKVVESFGRLDILVSNAAVFSAERDGKIDALDQIGLGRDRPGRTSPACISPASMGCAASRRRPRPVPWSARARPRACSA